MYRFSDEVVAKSGQVFENVQRAVYFNQKTKAVDRKSNIMKKAIEETVPRALSELLPEDEVNAS